MHPQRSPVSLNGRLPCTTTSPCKYINSRGLSNLSAHAQGHPSYHLCAASERLLVPFRDPLARRTARSAVLVWLPVGQSRPNIYNKVPEGAASTYVIPAPPFSGTPVQSHRVHGVTPRDPGDLLGSFFLTKTVHKNWPRALYSLRLIVYTRDLKYERDHDSFRYGYIWYGVWYKWVYMGIFPEMLITNPSHDLITAAERVLSYTQSTPTYNSEDGTESETAVYTSFGSV